MNSTKKRKNKASNRRPTSNRQPELKDDIRDFCKHCGGRIRWCALAQKWFHVANLMTFCKGMAINSLKAEPKKSYVTPK